MGFALDLVAGCEISVCCVRSMTGCWGGMTIEAERDAGAGGVTLTDCIRGDVVVGADVFGTETVVVDEVAILMIRKSSKVKLHGSGRPDCSIKCSPDSGS